METTVKFYNVIYKREGNEYHALTSKDCFTRLGEVVEHSLATYKDLNQYPDAIDDVIVEVEEGQFVFHLELKEDELGFEDIVFCGYVPYVVA